TVRQFAGGTSSQHEPWQIKQLMKPADLALLIGEGRSDSLHVYSIGPAGLIKGAVLIGETRDRANLAALKKAVSKLPKDAAVVLYCGCCPFKDCPNIRPAFEMLNKHGSMNHKLLDLSQNLKVD